jgi:hypothetical protein
VRRGRASTTIFSPYSAGDHLHDSARVTQIAGKHVAIRPRRHAGGPAEIIVFSTFINAPGSVERAVASG